jgi:MarR family transcriptional regulator, organic hydroperoxide resistance regulator
MMEQRSPNRSSERSGELLRELMCLVIQRSAGEMMRIMAAEGLSMPQMVSLHMLRDCGPLSISAIAEKLSLSLAATSHLVDRMVQHDLVLRSEDTTDRRQKRVAIAPSGKALLERLVQARLREATQIMAGLPPELHEQLDQVLEQVVGQLRQR